MSLRRPTLLHLLFAVLSLTALSQVAVGLLLYRRLQGELEADLARRLVHVSTLLTFSVDPSLVSQFGAGDEALPAYALVRRRLAAQAEAAGVTRAYVFDAGQRTLVDTQEVHPPGRVRHALLAHRTELAQAWDGHAVATRLYADEDGELRLSALAPLRHRDGRVVALVAVDAPPAFFSALGLVRREMLLLGAAAVGLLALAGGLVLRLERRARENERLAALGGMAGGLLHELGNPLAALTMYLDLLRPLVPEGEGRDLVERALREDARLREFLEDFRVFAGLARLRVEHVDLAEVIAGAAEPLPWPGEIQRHTTGSGRARGDSRLLVHAVRNLLRNALEALPNGGRIEVHGAGDGDEALIRLSDDGPGLTPAQIKRVREPFHTTKPQGSGLGLMIARRVAELHGGRLEVRSRPGAGVSFILRWPIAPERK